MKRTIQQWAKRLLAAVAVLFFSGHLALAQNYVLEYWVDFDFSSQGGDNRYYWDFIRYTTPVGIFTLPSSNTLMAKATGAYTVKDKHYFNAYRGPITKVELIGLARQKDEWLYWDTKCNENVVPYEVSEPKYAFDIKYDIDWKCLSSYQRVQTFKMYPDVTISAGSVTLDYSKKTNFSATPGFAAAVYQWEYGIGNTKEAASWKAFPAAYQGKSSFSANAVDILGSDLGDALAIGSHLYVRLNVAPFYSNVLTLNVHFEKVQAGSICASSPLHAMAPVTPGLIRSESAASKGTGDYTYQWQRAELAGGGSPVFSAIAGATGEEYQPDELTESAAFRRIVCDGISCDTTKMMAFNLSTPLLPGSVSPGGPSNIQKGTMPNAFRSTADASGGNGHLVYVWESSTDEQHWAPAFGFNGSATYQSPEVDTITYFRRRVHSQVMGNDVYVISNKIRVATYDPLSIKLLPQSSLSWFSGQPASLSVQVSGGYSYYSYMYSWQWSVDKINWAAVSDESTESYNRSCSFTAPTATGRYYYRCLVSNNGEQSLSSVFTTMVYPYSRAGLITGDYDIIKGDSLPAFTSVWSADCPEAAYQWEYSLNKQSWQPVPDATAVIYQPAALDTTTHFRRVATCGAETLYSNEVTVSVRPPLIAAKGLNNNTAYYGSPYYQLLAGTTPPSLYSGATGGDGHYAFEWQTSRDLQRWTIVEGAAAATAYQPPVLQDTAYYRCKVQSNGLTAYSDTVSMCVYTVLTAGVIGGEQRVVPGSLPTPLHSGALATGGFCNDLRYQWQDSTTYGKWRDIEGATEPSYQPGTPTQTRWYRRRVQPVCDGEKLTALYTNTVRVGLAGQIAGDQLVGVNNSVQPLYGVDPLPGSIFTYQWQDSSATHGWWDIPGATQENYRPLQYRRKFYPIDTMTIIPVDPVPPVDISPGPIGDLPPRELDPWAPQALAIATPIDVVTPIDTPIDLPIDKPVFPPVDLPISPPADLPLPGIEEELSPGVYYYRRRVRSASGYNSESNVVKITVREGPVGFDNFLSPTAYPVNYTVSCTPSVAVQDIAQLSLARQKQATVVDFYDGLGRPLQTILPLQASEDKDLVQWTTYDRQGRESKNYLASPVSRPGSAAAGKFIPLDEAVNTQQSFYGAEGPYAYGETFYDNSPLSRVERQTAPGASWRQRPVSQQLSTNTGAVNSWSVMPDNTFQPLTYAPNSLYVTTLTDENGVVSRAYKDAQGREVLTEQAGLRTSYVYDELDHLRVVVPPGVSGPGDTARCFYNHYDEQGRTIAQKTPGAGWVYAVYDRRNRKVMTTDARQLSGKRWTLQSYDDLNRPTTQEEVKFSAPFSPEWVRTLYALSTDLPFSERTVVSETYYDTPVSGKLAFRADAVVSASRLSATNRGRVMLTRSRVLSPDYAVEQYLSTAYYYDELGQLIQTVSENIQGGIDRISTAYLFSGQVDKSLQQSQWINGNDQPDSMRLLTVYNYDGLQRLKSTSITLNSNPPVTLSSLAYDDLGRLQRKTLTDNIEEVNYSYNIRSWPTKIQANLFGEELFYDQPLWSGAPGRYNGDITGVRWRGARQGEMSYAFTYDDLSRLTSSQYNNGSGWSANYTEQLSYDATGRIQMLRRYGGGGRLLDDLQYTYQDARLQKVEDKGAVDGHPQGTTHYGYDGNGNLIKDGSTGISNNLLNLPEHIQPSIGRSLKHTYAADGRKLIAAAQSSDGEYESYYSYAGNLVFDGNNELEYIIIPEGRILYNQGLPTIEYHLKDHLGNVRVAFTSGFRTPFIAQDNTYYPFGGLIKDLSYDSPTPFIEFTPGGYLSMGAKSNPFRYNGKELVNAYNLGWYDYGSRYYNPALGLFNSVDPQAHRGYGWGTYAYCLNNPMKYTDPNGEWIHLAIGAVFGGVLNWAFNGFQFNAEGLGYFATGALAGVVGAGVGGGVNVAMAGGSFGAGFSGAAAGVSSTGFVAGAATGASAGFAGGFLTGAGNAWVGGANFGEGLYGGLQSGGIGALTGGVTGGILGGIDAVTKNVDFWSGTTDLDMSKAYGATGKAVGSKTITGKYVGKFEGVNIYESSTMGNGAGATLPGRGIVLSKGQFSLYGSTRYTQELLQHEFGHILQAGIVGNDAYYAIIAPESLWSATKATYGNWNHNTFWTETWANYLSNNHFGVKSLLNNYMWPAQNISIQNLTKFVSYRMFGLAGLLF